MTVSLGPKGRDFVRAAIALACADGVRTQARSLAIERWGCGSAVTQYLLKSAEVAGTSDGGGDTGSWGGELVGTGPANEFLQAVLARSVIGQLSGLRRVPPLTRLISQTTGAGASWVGEGGAVPISRNGFTTTSLPFRKVASMAILTDELIRDSRPSAEAIIRQDLLRVCRAALDEALLDPLNFGNAATPASITAGLTPVSFIGDGTSPQDYSASLEALVADFQGDLTSSYFVSRPRWTTAPALAAPTFEVGVRGGQLHGAPLLVSDSAPPGLVLVDPIRVLAVLAEPTVSVSRSGSVEMETAPSGNASAPAGSEMVGLFQTNCTGIRVTLGANWEAAAGAVSYLEAPA